MSGFNKSQMLKLALKEKAEKSENNRLFIPAAVQNDSVWLQADELVLHSYIVKPSRFGINNEGVGQPQLVHKPTVQSQSLVGVVVGQAVIVPTLPQEHCHGVFLSGKVKSKSRESGLPFHQ